MVYLKLIVLVIIGILWVYGCCQSANQHKRMWNSGQYMRDHKADRRH